MLSSIITTNIQMTLKPTNTGAKHTYIISKLQVVYMLAIVHPVLAKTNRTES